MKIWCANRNVALLGAVVVLTCGLLPALGNAAETYVGAQRCRTCHAFEFSVWERSAHSRAHEALTEAQRVDPKCNTCHTMVAETGDKSNSIECERCHGPGKYYYPSYVMKDHDLARAVWLIDPKPEHCMQCHTDGAPSVRPFKFAEMWAKIDHGRAARDAWQKTRTREKPASKASSVSKPAK